MFKVRLSRLLSRIVPPMAMMSTLSLPLLLSGCGGAHFNAVPAATVSITASPSSISAGASSTLSVTAGNATAVTVSGSDGSSYTMQSTGGTQSVSPKTTTTYTATATGLTANASSSMILTVTTTTAPPPPAPTVSITASPTSVTVGGSSTLTVTASNATAVTVSGSDGSSFTLQASGGTQAVTPAATTTYTATASGAGGKATAMTAVAVTAAGAPPAAPTVTLSANPTSVTAGSPATLTVAASNATAVTVTGTDGSSYTLQANGGTQAVSPATTTTYTATANGAGGKATASAVVTVTAAGAPTPTVTISASPTTITAGNSSTLTVAATNATTVTVTGTDGSSYTLQANGGTQAISPAVTTTYTATASGAGGKTTASALVTVTAVAPAAPTVSVVANPTTIIAGNASTLTLAATNATTVTVSGTDGSSYSLQAGGGTQSVSPLATTTYTATATGAGGTATATATVTVTPAGVPPPATVSIVANPTSIFSGKSSTLTVTAVNATAVTITGTDSSSYTLQPAGGSQPVNPTVTTTYTATATGAGGNVTATATVTVTAPPAATVTIAASPTSVIAGTASTLTVVATNATAVNIAGTDGSSYSLAATGGTQAVTPTVTTTYTVTASGAGASATAAATVTVTAAGSVQSINHVVFMLQENHTFDNYFGMLNPYRQTMGWTQGDDGVTYTVDGIDDKLSKISNQDDSGNAYKLFKLASTCIDDDSSAWQSSYGDANRYDFLSTRPIKMDGFVHTAEGFATNCSMSGMCSGNFTDLNGVRAMGYYDQGFLNYYYFMASEFAVSNRWFSPIASKSVDNRIATFTGGTTQGLVDDPGLNDHLPQLAIPTIFNKLDKASVSWRIYYTVTQGYCLADYDDCGNTANDKYPATDFSDLTYSFNFLYENPGKAACTGTTQPSSVVGDTSNSFCIDPNHIAPISQYYTDIANGTLPSFAFIEAGYAVNDEHPGSGQSVLGGQYEMAQILNAFMTSASWKDSVFFFGYDEGGGPYEHVPPVPGHSNDFTDTALKASIPDIGSIAVNADNYFPCVPVGGVATLHCDLQTNWPGANAGDAPTVHGFAAQLGFRIPNFVVSPFTRRHYVSNFPMDHTAILKFVEDRFIGDKTYLTPRDAAQPNLLDFFDFNNVPWATPPSPPAPVTKLTLGYDPCTPTSLQ